MGVIQPPSDCWICHDTDEVLPITNFPRFSMPQFPWHDLIPHSIISDSLTLGVHFPISDKQSQSLNLTSKLIQRKIPKARVTGARGEQNTKMIAVYTPLKCTGLHGCHLSSPKPDSKRNY